MISVECVNCGAQNTTFLDDPNATSAVITCHSCGAVLPNPDRQASGSSPPPADTSAELSANQAPAAPKLDTPWVVSEHDIVAAPTSVAEADTVDSQWSTSAVWPPSVPEDAPSLTADVAPSAPVSAEPPALKNAVAVPVHAREEAPWVVSEQDIVSPLVTEAAAEKPGVVSQAPRVSMVVDPDGWDAPQSELAPEPPPSVEPMVLSKPTPIANPLAAAVKSPDSELPRTTLRLDAPPPPPPPPVVTRSYGEPPPPPPPPPPPIARPEAPDSELVATDRDAPLLDEFESAPRLQVDSALTEALPAPEPPREEVLPEALSQFPQDEQAASVVAAPVEVPSIEPPNTEARPAEAVIPTAPSIQLPAVPLAAVTKAAPAVSWSALPVASAEDARMPTDAPVARSASFVDLGHAAYSSPQRKWLQGALAAAAVAAAFVVGRATTTSTPAKPTQAEIQAAAAQLLKEREAARPSAPPPPAAAPVKEAAAATAAAAEPTKEPTKVIIPDADAATVVTRTGKHNAATLAAAVEAANKAGFDPNAAGRALGEAAARASSCKRPGDNATQATVFVTFGPSGKVAGANVSGIAFSSAAMRNCIGQVLKDVRVPAFSGAAPVTVKKVVRI